LPHPGQAGEWQLAATRANRHAECELPAKRRQTNRLGRAAAYTNV